MATEEDEELARIRAQADALWSGQAPVAGAPRGGGGAPRVPVQEQPDVQSAERNARFAARERFDLSSGPTGESSLKAEQFVRSVVPRPAPIPAEPGWLDQLALSFLPHVETTDNRPLTALDRAKNAAAQSPELAKQMVAPGLSLASFLGENALEPLTGVPFELPPSPAELVRRQLAPPVAPEDQGTPTENGALYLMRVLGTGSAAVITETAERLPHLDVTGASAKAEEGASIAAVMQEFFTPRALGEQVLGVHPDEFLRTDRGNAVANWAQGILERIEKGTGFERDLAEGAKRRLGPEWENTGWWTGLAIDTLTNWEGALAKGPRAVAKIAESARGLGSMVPPGMELERSILWEAVKGNELESGAYIGDRLVEEVIAGRLSIDDLPTRVLVEAEQVAVTDFHRPLREQAEIDGLGKVSSVVDPKLEALQARAKAAQQAYSEATKATKPKPRPKPPAPTPTPTPTPADGVADVEALGVGLKAAFANAKNSAREGFIDSMWGKVERGEGIPRMGALENELRDLQKAGKLTSRADVEAVVNKHHPPQPAAPAVTPAPTPAPTPVQPPPAAIRGRSKQLGTGTPGVDPGSFRSRRVRISTGRTAVRSRLPPFERGQHVNNHAEFWERTVELIDRLKTRGQYDPLGYHIIPNEGWRRFDDALEQDINDPVYELRAANGDVVERGVGTLEEVLDMMLTRRTDGDGVWYEGRRPVARWSQTVESAGRFPRLAWDYFFTSPLEERVIKLIRTDDPRAIQGRFIRQGGQVLDVPAPSKAPPTPAAGPARTPAAAVGGGGASGTGPAASRAPAGAPAGDPTTPSTAPPPGRAPAQLPEVTAPKGGAGAARGGTPSAPSQAPAPKGSTKPKGKAKPPKAPPVEPAALAKAQQTIGEALADVVTGAPTRATGKPRSDLVTAEILRRAARNVVRRSLGTDRLKMLPNTAIVAREDHGKALARADQALGMTADDVLPVLRGQRQLTPDQAKVWKALAPGVNTDAPTAADWRRVHNEAIARAAGSLADTRYRIEGIRPLMQRFMTAFKDAHVRRFKGGAWQDKGRLGWIGAQLTRWFGDDVFARMPTAVSTTWRELKGALESSPDDLRRTLEAAGTDPGKLEDALRDVLEGYRFPRPEHVDKATMVREAKQEAELVQHLDELRASWTGTDRPRWLEHQDQVIALGGLKAWARDVRHRAADIARDWILTNAAVAKKDIGPETSLYQAVKQIADDELFQVYVEFARRGKTPGPELQRHLAELGSEVPDPKQALVSFVLHVRNEALISSAVQRMIGAGMVVRRSDPRLPALEAVLLDKHRTWDDATKRWEYHYPEAQVTWSLNRLRDWAIEPGSQVQLVSVRGGRTEVKVPKFLADEVTSLVQRGIVGSRDLTPLQIANRLYRYTKEGLTHGLIVPNPTYFTGAMLGLLPTLVVTRGLGGATSALGQMIYGHPVLTGDIVRRLDGKGLPVFRPRSPDGALLRTDAGEVYTSPELADVGRRFGLHETRPDYEVARTLTDLLRAADDTGPLLWHKIKRAPKVWQDQIREFAGAIDLNARIAVFVDEVKRGAPPEQAALKAREAVLDFRDLTRDEQRVFRLIFTFYSFMRKNSDAHVKALLLHPERVLGQMRLAHASLTNSGLSSVELGAMTDADVSRLTVYSDEEVVNDAGRVHTLYRLNRFTSTPIGVPEWLGTLRMFAPIPTAYGGLEAPDTRGLLQSLNPAGQVFMILTAGQRLERDFDRPWNNRIPPFLLDMPAGDFALDAFGVGPEFLEGTDDPLLADDDATLELGAPAYWAAGSTHNAQTSEGWRVAQRRLWQLTMVFAGRGLGTLEGAAVVAGAAEPPPHATWSESTVAYLLGLQIRPALDEWEARRRKKFRDTTELRKAQEAVRPPRGVGPR